MKCNEFENVIYSLDPADHKLKDNLKDHYESCDTCRANNPNVAWILTDLSFPIIVEENPALLYANIQKSVTQKRVKTNFTIIGSMRNMAAVISFLLCLSFVSEYYNVEAPASSEINYTVNRRKYWKRSTFPVLKQKLEVCFYACNNNWKDCDACNVPSILKEI